MNVCQRPRKNQQLSQSSVWRRQFQRQSLKRQDSQTLRKSELENKEEAILYISGLCVGVGCKEKKWHPLPLS